MALKSSRLTPTRKSMGSSEIALRLSGIRAGVRVTLGLAAAASAYLLATPEGPHRLALSVIPLLAAFDGLLVAILVRERAVRTERRHNLLVAAWNVLHSATAIAACLLDGGITSPFTAIFFISVAFAAASLPPRPVALIALADVIGLTVVAAVSGEWAEGLMFQIPALGAIAALCTSIADARSRSVAELQHAKQGMLHRLARVIEYRDNETGEHTERMSAYCGVVARRL
jgi:hypothetical protein